MRELLKHLASVITALVVVGGAFWTVVRPYAQEFVNDTVAESKFASQQALDDIAEQTEALTDEQRKQGISQIRIESDLATIKSLQSENRSDVKLILRGLRDLND